MDEHQNPFASPLAEEAPVAPSGDLAEAEAIRREHLSREASIKSVGVLYYLGAAISTIGVIGLLVSVITGPPGGEAMGFFLGAFVVYALIAALLWWIAPGLRRLNPKVRPWVIGLNALLLALSVIGLNPIGALINGYIIWLMSGEKARTVFSPDYQDVIRATPHIKYKTSIVVWILLGLVLLLLLLAIVGVSLA